MTFEEELTSLIKNRILEQVTSVDIINASVRWDARKRISEDFIEGVWNSVDWEEVIKNVKPELEKRIANKIVESMATQIKNDVGTILEVKSVREGLRMKVYPKLMAVLKGED